MTNEQQEHMNRAKAWCFDNGVTELQIQTAWNNALETNAIIQNLDKHGNSWWWLPPHLLKKLFDMYLPKASKTTEQPSEAAAEEQVYGNDCRNGQC